MVTRKRISGKRQKRHITSHLGRALCCIDFITKPPCVEKFEEIIARDVLITHISGGFSGIQEGIYTFGCIITGCTLRWISPDTSDIFQLQSSGAGPIVRVGMGAGAIDGTACNVKPSVAISDTSFGGSKPTFNQWACDGVPIRLDRLGLGITSNIFDAKLLP